MSDRVGVLILNWNGWADTLECLESVFHQDHPDLRVVVCDNGSENDSLVRIRRWAGERAIPFVEYDRAALDGGRAGLVDLDARLVVIRIGANLGFVGGNNVGIDYLRHRGDIDHVLLLNNDAVLDPPAISALVAEARKDGVGAVMPLIRYYADGGVWYAGGTVIRPWGRVQHRATVDAEEPYPSEIFTACCVLIPLAVFEAVGAFDPRYFLYLEDTELALRIREAGYDIRVEPRAVAHHKVSRSSGGSESPNVIYYLIRNNLLLISDRSAGAGERWLGYGYVGAMSAKIMLNLFVRHMPRKAGVAGAILQAWRDFRRSRWGARQ